MIDRFFDPHCRLSFALEGDGRFSTVPGSVSDVFDGDYLVCIPFCYGIDGWIVETANVVVTNLFD